MFREHLPGGIVSSTLKVFTHDGNRLVFGTVTTGTNSQPLAYDLDGRPTLLEDEGLTEIRYNAVGYPSFVGMGDNGYVHNTFTQVGHASLHNRLITNLLKNAPCPTCYESMRFGKGRFISICV